jgi:DNA-binding LytR/AlgR family response regulator
MPTAVIADDEDLALAELRRRLAVAWPELVIVAQCDQGADALEAIVMHKPDVAFLDIRMPGLSGLDVAHAVKAHCQIVFTTAYDSHAIDAFNLGALDYLLKPIAPDRLAQTVDRLRKSFDSGGAAPEILRMMAELDKRLAKADQGKRMRWISASVGDSIRLVPIDEVLFFESCMKYTRVVSATDEVHVRLTLRELQQGLDPDQFWQIHRGTIVCLNAIARIRRDELGAVTVELRDHDERLKVSRAYAWRFKGDSILLSGG